MIRIGTTSMVFWHWEILECLKHVEECGFDAIEIWVSQFKRQKDLTPKQLNRLLKKAGLTATVHVPIRDINIASVNDGIRRESVRQMIEAVDFCKEIEGVLVVVHPGKRSSRHDDIEEQWIYQVDSFNRILEEAKTKGVVVTVENMEWENENALVRTAQDIERLQSKLPEFHLLVTLDTTHMGNTECILNAMDMLGGDIVHIHLSDFNTKHHIPIGRGNINFHSIIKKLRSVKYEGILSLEVFIPPSDESVQKLKAERQKVLSLV